MNETDDLHQVPADVRAAIGAFLNECQKNAQPFAVSKALNAVRRIFPDLEISDADLMDAITSEASIAGLDIDFDIPAASETVKRTAIERWDNEGGAVGSSSATAAQRRLDNDTNGVKRRARDTKHRNDLV